MCLTFTKAANFPTSVSWIRTIAGPWITPQRQSALANHGCSKQEIIAALLSLRKDDPELWTLGSYEPLPMQTDDDRLFAFRRRNAQSTLLALINRTASPGQAARRYA